MNPTKAAIGALTLLALGHPATAAIPHSPMAGDGSIPISVHAPLELLGSALIVQSPVPGSATMPIEVAQSARCERLRDRLAKRRDDRILNPQDFFRLRRRGC